MPSLDTSLHTQMYESGNQQRSLTRRIRRAAKILLGKQDLYGLEWGDPDTIPPLAYIRDHFLLPYVRTDINAIEIGPGGGRWTRYMYQVNKLYAVDYHQEILDEFKKNFNQSNIVLIKNNGNDFPGILENCIDLVFSFGVFVHLDPDIIDCYLKNLKPLLKDNSNVIIQYSDKTKPMGKLNDGFSDNNPEKMRRLIANNGYQIFEEDLQTLWHSSMIRFGLAD